MEKQEINISFEKYESVASLPAHIRQLMERAQEARQTAYAPYSNFKVGAAVLLKNGEIIIGSNQENAAYPSGLCAERVAIFAAGANFPNEEISAIAITAGSVLQISATPVAPCGSCRQSMIEYEQKQKSDIAVYFMGEEGPIIKIDSISNLLPFSFGAIDLLLKH